MNGLKRHQGGRTLVFRQIHGGETMNRIVHEQWGRWSLVLSLVWAGLVCAIFPPQQNASASLGQPDDFERLQVAYRPKASASAEQVFPEGSAGDYRHDGLYVWTGKPKGPTRPWPELDVPVRASTRPVAFPLPDPGPSLEGTGRLSAEEVKGIPPLPRIAPGTDAKR